MLGVGVYPRLISDEINLLGVKNRFLNLQSNVGDIKLFAKLNLPGDSSSLIMSIKNQIYIITKA